MIDTLKNTLLTLTFIKVIEGMKENGKYDAKRGLLHG